MIIIILSAAAITESCKGNRWGRALQNTNRLVARTKSSKFFLVGAGRRKRTLASNYLYNLIFKTPEKCWDLLPSLADISIVSHSKVSLIPWWPSDSSLHFLHQFSSRKTLYHKSKFKFSNEDCQCQTLGGGARGYNGIQSISHDQHLQCSSTAYKWITSESEQQPHTATQIAIVSLLLLLRSRKKIMHIPTEPILNSSYTRFSSNSCSKSLKSIQDRCNRVARGSLAAVTRAWDRWSQFPIKAE